MLEYSSSIFTDKFKFVVIIYTASKAKITISYISTSLINEWMKLHSSIVRG
tara:strand:- start:8695 stop:8847 length:153 start_codon:yes stop_codon:yes gene_type:complete